MTSTVKSFQKLRKSFEGHLVGTLKASHTLTNYKSDLNTFEAFIAENSPGKKPSLQHVQSKLIDQYSEYLKAKGFRTNTRRRKLLTLRKCFRYLEKRGQVRTSLSTRMLTPDRTTRIPYAPDFKDTEKWLQKWQPSTRIEATQKASIQLILETGCLAHEAAQITAASFETQKQESFVHFVGKNARKVPVSSHLAKAWIQSSQSIKPVTSRTIELWVKQVFAQSKNTSKITPRALRHARVLKWMQEKKTDSQIMSLIGLKSDYAFRMYRVWFEKLKQKE